ncbi:tetratricopeptide repeat protein [Pendulispora brunnea]|uniref:Tetratricopeptide repeat protein n=1 Tax=Pendulispora brunnea TaxID=2905690 RepID=A0ABZ2KB15_9BACT
MAELDEKSAKRLKFLEKITADGSTDPLAWYGLALEYSKAERYDEALQTFTTLRTFNADYVPMYLMCGQMLSKCERWSEARDWLEAGVAVATRKGESHALGELRTALQGVLFELGEE